MIEHLSLKSPSLQLPGLLPWQHSLELPVLTASRFRHSYLVLPCNFLIFIRLLVTTPGNYVPEFHDVYIERLRSHVTCYYRTVINCLHSSQIHSPPNSHSEFRREWSIHWRCSVEKFGVKKYIHTSSSKYEKEDYIGENIRF